MSHQTTINITPLRGPQNLITQSNADIRIFGGGAGGGKTTWLIHEAARYINDPLFNAVLFRRTYPEITGAGGLWDETHEWLPYLGGRPSVGNLEWSFNSGARVQLRHLQHEKDVHRYQGWQICYIGFDELTHFTEKQFWYLFSRNRRVGSLVVPFINATCNPDPDSFVREFLDWYIGSDGLERSDRVGLVRWFVRVKGGLAWSGDKDELTRKYPKVTPKSIVFVPSSVYDNYVLLEKNPEYVGNLQALTLVEQARLLDRNWNARYGAGKLFNEHWFEIVDEVPKGGMIVRAWDFAATVPHEGNPNPDATASVKMRVVGETFYIEDVIEEQIGPQESEALFVSTSVQDGLELAENEQNTLEMGHYKVRWEEEPGSAAKRDTVRLRNVLDGMDADGVSTEGKNKLLRWKPLAIAAQPPSHKVKLKRASWNEKFLKHAHNQPQKRDDIMDAAALAYNTLKPLYEGTGIYV